MCIYMEKGMETTDECMYVRREMKEWVRGRWRTKTPTADTSHLDFATGIDMGLAWKKDDKKVACA